MANIHIVALHDRIDEEHFEMRLHTSAIAALQQRVLELEAAVRELRRLAFDEVDTEAAADRRLAKSVPRRSRASARRGSQGNLQVR